MFSQRAAMTNASSSILESAEADDLDSIGEDDNVLESTLYVNVVRGVSIHNI